MALVNTLVCESLSKPNWLAMYPMAAPEAPMPAIAAPKLLTRVAKASASVWIRLNSVLAWLVIGGESIGKRQGFMGIQGEGEQAHHQALVCFRGVAGESERMIMVVIAVHVGDLHLYLENGCLEGHSITLTVDVKTPHRRVGG